LPLIPSICREPLSRNKSVAIYCKILNSQFGPELTVHAHAGSGAASPVLLSFTPPTQPLNPLAPPTTSDSLTFSLITSKDELGLNTHCLLFKQQFSFLLALQLYLIENDLKLITIMLRDFSLEFSLILEERVMIFCCA
jgi:hypothetical protein